MFPTSTQRKYWTFSGEAELVELRKEANDKFIAAKGSNIRPADVHNHFLSCAEERLLLRHFEYILREFCNRFTPAMPKYVLGTALTYFKRFYVHTSVMDYHPKDMMLTCVYMACKVEEFNVSIGQFVGNLKGDREKFANIILGFELLLMDKLHYHLTVHNPYRPLEGLFIDIKTRYKGANDVERLRKGAEEFLDKALATDACLMFAPSQARYNDNVQIKNSVKMILDAEIALAAILSSATKESMNLDSYVTDVLCKSAPLEEVNKTIYQIKRIKSLVKSQEPLKRDQIAMVQKKLEQCRNQENNPESEVYKRKLEEMFEEEEEVRSRKRARIDEEEKKIEAALLT